jgi:hypothetical protein
MSLRRQTLQKLLKAVKKIILERTVARPEVRWKIKWSEFAEAWIRKGGGQHQANSKEDKKMKPDWGYWSGQRSRVQEGESEVGREWGENEHEDAGGKIKTWALNTLSLHTLFTFGELWRTMQLAGNTFYFYSTQDRRSGNQQYSFKRELRFSNLRQSLLQELYWEN